MHTYNENLQSTFLKMLKYNFAMFSIWQASTWQTGVVCKVLDTVIEVFCVMIAILKLTEV